MSRSRCRSRKRKRKRDTREFELAVPPVSEVKPSGLVVGCGYLGQRVARAWRDLGWTVAALTRSDKRAAEFSGQGLAPVLGDVTHPDSLAALPQSDVVLFAVGRDRERTSQSMREVSLDGLENVLDVLGETTTRFIFISSTGVYAQSEGDWVNEDSPTKPTRENGRVLVEAEALVRSRLGKRGCVLRLAGLYGPGRLISRRETLMASTPLGGRPDAWLNLVHVDDAARAVVTASTIEADYSENGMWLICDDRPVRREEFFGRLAELFGAPPPIFDAARGGSRIDGLGKRCQNARLKQDLGLELLYPDFEMGLPAAIGDQLG